MVACGNWPSLPSFDRRATILPLSSRFSKDAIDKLCTAQRQLFEDLSTDEKLQFSNEFRDTAVSTQIDRLFEGPSHDPVPWREGLSHSCLTREAHDAMLARLAKFPDEIRPVENSDLAPSFFLNRGRELCNVIMDLTSRWIVPESTAAVNRASLALLYRQWHLQEEFVHVLETRHAVKDRRRFIEMQVLQMAAVLYYNVHLSYDCPKSSSLMLANPSQVIV